MKTYTYSREELLNWIPSYVLDTCKKEELLKILCKVLNLEFDKCDNIEIVESKTMSPHFKFDYIEHLTQ